MSVYKVGVFSVELEQLFLLDTPGLNDFFDQNSMYGNLLDSRLTFPCIRVC